MSSRSPSVVSGDDEEEELGYSDDSGEYDFEEDHPRARTGMNYSYRSTRKRSKRMEKPDRISDLPDSVLLHIISFLPIEDAIKTDVLSKRWQYLWTFTPILDFSHHRITISKHEFLSFVKKSLVLCGSSNIREFRVKFRYMKSNASNVDLWTRFAAKNKVEELSLDLFDCQGGFGNCDCYKLPQHLYSNSSIRGLSLSLCEVVPNGLISWRALKNLSIGYVELSEEVIQNILLGSPVLESLELYYFRGIQSLNICSASVRKLVIREYWGSHNSYFGAQPSDEDEDEDTRLDVLGPNLHCLEILGDLHRKKCKLMNVPSLVEANLYFEITTYADGDYEENQSLLRELLESLKHVPNLGLGQWCIQVLQTLETESLPSPSYKRKHLTLHTRISKRNLPVIPYLLESSPYLETLVIEMDFRYSGQFASESSFIDDNDYDETIFWTSQKRTSKCSVQHLRTVRISNFIQGSCRFEFLKFLLQKARVLKRMTIHAPNSVCSFSTSRESFHSAQKLLSFPRSSPHAVVMLSE